VNSRKLINEFIMIFPRSSNTLAAWSRDDLLLCSRFSTWDTRVQTHE
jgi:hypothetical protein